MRILFVITARGGSKGIPKKNITNLGGMPLIAYKINAAKGCKFDKRIIVSTDNEEIAAVAKKYGAEVPFVRPYALATDTARSEDVVQHAIEWVKMHDEKIYDYVCLLEPSSPFLTYEDINEAFERMEESKADTLLGMKEVDVSRKLINTLDERGMLGYFFEEINGLNSIRRQDFATEYTMNGCIYAARFSYFEFNKTFHSFNSIPYIMSKEKSVEIDSPYDLLFAQFLIENEIIDISKWY